jgi:hypothetical protein
LLRGDSISHICWKGCRDHRSSSLEQVKSIFWSECLRCCSFYFFNTIFSLNIIYFSFFSQPSRNPSISVSYDWSCGLALFCPFLLSSYIYFYRHWILKRNLL